jgi:hypothetical protein
MAQTKPGTARPKGRHPGKLGNRNALRHGLHSDRLLTDDEGATYAALCAALTAELAAADGEPPGEADRLLIDRAATQVVKARRKDRYDATLRCGLPASTAGDLDIDAKLLAAVRALGVDRRFRATPSAATGQSDDLATALARLGDDAGPT